MGGIGDNFGKDSRGRGVARFSGPRRTNGKRPGYRTKLKTAGRWEKLGEKCEKGK